MNKEFIFKTVNINEKSVTVVASDETLDRQGEVIKADGWDLTNFKKNPVMLVFHDYHQLPVGKWNAYVKDGKLYAEAEFADTERGREVRDLVMNGFLNTVSVGFMVLERDEKDSNIITKAELLEISWVPVPANPSALVQLAEKGYSFSCGKTEEFEKQEKLFNHYREIVKEYRKLLKKLNKYFDLEYKEETDEVTQIENVKKFLSQKETPSSETDNQETPDIKELVKEELIKALRGII